MLYILLLFGSFCSDDLNVCTMQKKLFLNSFVHEYSLVCLAFVSVQKCFEVFPSACHVCAVSGLPKYRNPRDKYRNPSGN